MADGDAKVLLKLGPFGGFDSRTDPVYLQPTQAPACSNADTHRSGGALGNFFGRSPLWEFTILGQGAELAISVRYVAAANQEFFVAQDGDGNTAYLDCEDATQASLTEMGADPFTQAIQSNGVLYCNNGKQIFLGPDGNLHVAQWQYPAPDPVAFQYKVGPGPTGQGQLAAGVYDYAFVQVISIPMADGTVVQQTSPTGASSPYPYTYTATGTIPANINAVNDPHSLISIEPAIFTDISTGTTVTITSTGAGTFNISDTLGSFYNNVPAGSIVTIGGATFTLTSATDIPPGNQASFVVVPNSIVNASITGLSDPDSCLTGTPTVLASISQNDSITITSNGATYDIADTLGHSMSNVAGGTTVHMGGATFTLNSSVPSSGDVASFVVNAMAITLASVTSIMDPFSIFDIAPTIIPNVPASAIVSIESNGDGTYNITDSLGHVQNDVEAGSWVFIAGSYFGLTYATASNGDKATYAINAQVNGLPAKITGIFAGTTDDGYPYVTKVYRYSSNSPNWFLLTTITTNIEYFDTASDTSITGNEQLALDRDQPPCSTVPGSPIAAHQDRMWNFAIVQNADTNNVPQTQAQYSNLGQPWSFNLIDQALLVEDDQTPIVVASAEVPNGSLPNGLLSLGSSLMMFKTDSTFMMYGVDQNSYQPLKLFPDIGLLAPGSLFWANGLLAWLAAQGPFLYDGSSLQWIGKEIYNALQAIPPPQLVRCVGFYGDQQLFFSFPDVPITFVYYLPDKMWTTLPYATNAASFASSSQSNPLGASFKMNEIVAVRPGTAWIDAWLEGKENDLGAGIPVSWVSKIENSGMPETQKDYQFVALEAPQQPQGTIATVLFQADPGSPTAPPSDTLLFDLSKGPYVQTLRIKEGSSRGYACQVTLSYTTPVGATQPVLIKSLSIGGYPQRPFTILDNANV